MKKKTTSNENWEVFGWHYYVLTIHSAQTFAFASFLLFWSLFLLFIVCSLISVLLSKCIIFNFMPFRDNFILNLLNCLCPWIPKTLIFALWLPKHTSCEFFLTTLLFLFLIKWLQSCKAEYGLFNLLCRYLITLHKLERSYVPSRL